jgi:hypothetical protein
MIVRRSSKPVANPSSSAAFFFAIGTWRLSQRKTATVSLGLLRLRSPERKVTNGGPHQMSKKTKEVRKAAKVAKKGAKKAKK